MAKVTELISHSISHLEGSFDVDTFVGKQVLTEEGEKLGRVTDLVIHGFAIRGIMVGKRLFIDKSFIDNISDEAIMLSINPVTQLIGKTIIDADGRIIGKVIRLERKGAENDFTNLVVRKNIIFKPIIIPKSNVSVSEKNIILKKAVK